MNEKKLYQVGDNPLTKWLYLSMLMLIIKIFYQYYSGFANFNEIALQGGGLSIVYILYLRRSYYAWHALAIFLLSAVPISFLFHQDNLANYSILTFVIVWGGFFIIILKLHNRYIQYLGECRGLFIDSGTTESHLEMEGELRAKIKTEQDCAIGTVIWIVLSFILFVVLIMICRRYQTEKMEKIYYLVGGLLLVWAAIAIFTGIVSLLKVLYYRYKLKQISNATNYIDKPKQSDE